MDSNEQLFEGSIAYFGGPSIATSAPEPWKVTLSFHNPELVEPIRQRFESNFNEPMALLNGTELVGKCASRKEAEAFCNHLSSILERLDDKHMKSPFRPGWLSEYLSNYRCGISQMKKEPDEGDRPGAFEASDAFFDFSDFRGLAAAAKRHAYAELLGTDMSSLVDEWIAALNEFHPQHASYRQLRDSFWNLVLLIQENATSEHFTFPEFLEQEARPLTRKIIAHNTSLKAVNAASYEETQLSNYFSYLNRNRKSLPLNAVALEKLSRYVQSLESLVSLPRPSEQTMSEPGATFGLPRSGDNALRLLPFDGNPVSNTTSDGADPAIKDLVRAFIQTVYVTVRVNNTERCLNFIHRYADSMNEHSLISDFSDALKDCFKA